MKIQCGMGYSSVGRTLSLMAQVMEKVSSVKVVVN